MLKDCLGPLVLVSVLVALALLLYNVRCREIGLAVTVKDRLEAIVAQVVKHNLTVQGLPDIAPVECWYQVDAQGAVTDVQGTYPNCLSDSKNQRKLAKCVKLRKPTYLYMRDPDHSSSVVAYIHPSCSQSAGGTGFVTLSTCRLKLRNNASG